MDWAIDIILKEKSVAERARVIAKVRIIITNNNNNNNNNINNNNNNNDYKIITQTVTTIIVIKIKQNKDITSDVPFFYVFFLNPRSSMLETSSSTSKTTMVSPRLSLL